MKLPVTVRPTQPEDAVYLTQWLTAPDVLRWFPMIDQREIDDAVRLWVSYARLEAGLTIEWEGIPCGMSNLYIQPFKKLAHQCLFSIIVSEEYRGKGVGTVLLENLIKYAKEKFHIEILHLEVYEGNPAMRLYQRMGFKQFGCQAHFIKENERYNGKIYMQLTL